MAQRHGEMRFRLAVCAEAGGVLACGRREAEHGDSVSGAGGVVDEPRQLRGVLAADVQCGEDAGVQLAAAQRRQRILDGAPGQLVPERYGTLVQGENP
jgi:hypothetical protein